MIGNTTTYICEFCAEKITIENKVDQVWSSITIVMPPEWDYKNSPNDDSSVMLCPKCKDKKIVWKMTAQLEDGE